MPTYDYRCNACDHEFELFQSMSAKVKRKCPSCGKNALERLIGTGAAVLFKGSGFYETDYRSKSYKDAAKSEKEASGKPSGDAAAGAGKAEKPAKADAGAKTEKTGAKGSSASKATSGGTKKQSTD